MSSKKSQEKKNTKKAWKKPTMTELTTKKTKSGMYPSALTENPAYYKTVS